jgi:hypothetical protein
MHRITEGGRVCYDLKPSHGVDKQTPSTGWLRVQHSGHKPQTGKEMQCVVCSTGDKPGNVLNVQSAKWYFVLSWIRLSVETAMKGCVFLPALGYFTPNHSSQTKTSQGKADNTMVSTIFYYLWIFFNVNIFI